MQIQGLEFPAGIAAAQLGSKAGFRPRRTICLVLFAAVLCTAWWPQLAALAQSPEPQSQRPQNSVALGEVRQSMGLGQWAAAELQLRSLLNANPRDAEAQYLLGYVLLRSSKPVPSLAAYTAAAQLRSPGPDDLAAVASDYILLKDYADAEHWLQVVVRDSPKGSEFWYLLGRTQYNLDQAAEATKSFSRCLALSPRDARAEYNLGLAYERLQRPAEAQAAYEQAILWGREQGKADAQPYLDLGMLLLGQEQDEAALTNLTRAVELSPRNPLALQELGLALDALGRSAEAVSALLHAIELAPSAEKPHYFLGRIYRRLGEKAKAEEQFADVQKLLGTHSDAGTPNLEPRP